MHDDPVGTQGWSTAIFVMLFERVWNGNQELSYEIGY